MKRTKRAAWFVLVFCLIGVAGWATWLLRPVPIWTAYVAGRAILATAAGRNPMCKGDSGPSVSTYYQMISARKRDRNCTLLERDAAGRTRWHCQLGDLWVPAGADPTFAGQLSGEQIANAYGYFEPGRRNGATVLDCGANIGTFTKWALQRGAQKVVAI
jgi:hypothetical protein